MKILVIRQGAIGDIVVTIPTIELLRESYPNAHIEILGNVTNLELVNDGKLTNKATPAEAKLTPGLYIEDGDIDPEIRDYFSSFDIILAYMKDTDGVIARNLQKAGAEKIFKMSPFPSAHGPHAVEYTAEMLEFLGIKFTPPLYPHLRLQKSYTESAYSLLKDVLESRPLVAIHPRTWGVKSWPLESFISIGRWIEESVGAKSVWLIGPVEEESAAAIEYAFPFSPVVKERSLMSVAAVLEMCDLYFGCDTGISHIASAVGTPVITLFGPTDPDVWAPRGESVTVIKTDNLRDIGVDFASRVIADVMQTMPHKLRIINHR
ncbi:MAG: glycosyltransferase family 9 protein [Candidatus Dadabacteria bacterium]|nr:glycosyltransferase family 9 protein [Candidatus Dadabacteria bacterium]